MTSHEIKKGKPGQPKERIRCKRCWFFHKWETITPIMRICNSCGRRQWLIKQKWATIKTAR
jgi:hypothetical protein